MCPVHLLAPYLYLLHSSLDFNLGKCRALEMLWPFTRSFLHILTLQVVDLIASDIMPMLRESGMAGRAEYLSDLRL